MKKQTVTCGACGEISGAQERACPECGFLLPELPGVPKERQSKLLREEMLECTEGTSNKEYFVVLRQDEGIYIVEAQWGPRGRMGGAQEKKRTNNLAMAQRAFETLLSSKKKKGYVTEWEKIHT